MLRPNAPKRRRLVVHLGNVGLNLKGEHPSEKTRNHAERFPRFDFIGIDPRPDTSPKPPNWRQFEEDAVRGLKKLEDNSADVISSDIALGYYGKPINPIDDKYYVDRMSLKEDEAIDLLEVKFMDNPLLRLGSHNRERYTAESLKLAFKKLKPGGKLLVSVGAQVKESVMGALLNAGFEPKKIRAREFTEKETGKTFWTRLFHERQIKLYQIIAQK